MDVLQALAFRYVQEGRYYLETVDGVKYHVAVIVMAITATAAAMRSSRGIMRLGFFGPMPSITACCQSGVRGLLSSIIERRASRML